MLTRLYLDNYRCFVDFEHRPASKELILGPNGSGKSSLLEALLWLRQFVVMGVVLDEFFILGRRTRWLDKTQITAEIEASLNDGVYLYRLVVEPSEEDSNRSRVACEDVFFDGKPIFQFTNGEVRLFNDQHEENGSYDFDRHRSALATVPQDTRNVNRKLSQFKQWLSSLYCFKLNPFSMAARAEADNLYPKADLSNFAAWYRHLIQADPKRNSELLISLREALDEFSFLKLEAAGENVRLLMAEFHAPTGRDAAFYFNELSDGQRCLISLYTVLHFIVNNGGTVILDEPDNFLSLREIQPWLIAIDDAILEHQGQVVIISHHPEMINQWAPRSGIVLVREQNGPVRVERFVGDPESPLLPSELIARGWTSE